MQLTLAFPELVNDLTGMPVWEHVEARLVAPGEWQTSHEVAVAELRAHSLFVPLVPGDVVQFDPSTLQVLGVVHYEPTWTVDVEFATPSNLVAGQGLSPDVEVAIASTVESWNREAYCTRVTGLAALVSAESREWVQDRVTSHPYVAHAELVRYPDMEIDFETIMRHASFDGPGSST